MPKKGEKVTDEAYLAMLAKARERANAVRKEKADEKKKIKLADELEHQKKVMDAERKIKGAFKEPEEAEAEPPPKKKKPAKRPVTPPSSESDSEADHSDSESEPEVESAPPPPKAKKVAFKSKSAPIEQHSAAPQKSLAAQKTLTAQQRKMMSAYRSLYL